ncbi:FAD-binding domain-containing protein [Grimontia marina]|uniref:Cryptochrome-like protein cry2 n=1 Tax=Grimontia marina TaxID=646534 RepID=A0A128EUJ9_9GAMM|nr:deoxyribodipyrimidine photo-lyase [Grimontia marina]CZF77785.1 Cryptochrome-like protein cry2 [Grimontia marina]
MPSSPTQNRDAISLVWFKRDLRLTDHAPLQAAIASGLPVLLLYVFEPISLEDEHYSERHWRFVWQSLEDLNQQLAPFGGKVLVVRSGCIEALSSLHTQFKIKTLYSHEETGLMKTFARDKEVGKWCKEHEIDWQEHQTGAVKRGAISREGWDKAWDKTMRAPVVTPNLEAAAFINNQPAHMTEFVPPATWQSKQRGMQTGGPTLAWKTLHSFYEGRGKSYAFKISKPAESRNHCSRLSPYLAWGNLSVREVYQTLLQHWNVPGWRRSLSALSSRFHWHCHFIQKFESECEMEFRHVNRGYEAFPYRKDEDITKDLACWMQGMTGYPLVDACMRCLHATGYINFRMRSMLVSFLCHHLNIDWRWGVKHLASLFLDFEPGIHYAQFQMQASVTGTNTIRIYNPTKQAQEHDPDAAFIHRWLPELKKLPPPLVFEPWLLTPLEQKMYGISIGEAGDYPEPCIVLDAASKVARDRLWSWKKRAEVKKESKRILTVHVRPE